MLSSHDSPTLHCTAIQVLHYLLTVMNDALMYPLSSLSNTRNLSTIRRQFLCQLLLFSSVTW